MNADLPDHLLSLELAHPIWNRFFTVAPLALIATRNPDGSEDLLMTHQVLPLAPANLLAFIAKPQSPCAVNCSREGEFAVSLPTPEQVVQASLAASHVPATEQLRAEIATFPAAVIDATLLEGAQLYLECKLERQINDLDHCSLLVGRVVAAHIDREARRLAERDDHELLADHPLLAYVAPGRFAEIGETGAFPNFE